MKIENWKGWEDLEEECPKLVFLIKFNLLALFLWPLTLYSCIAGLMIWRNDMTKNPNDKLTNARVFLIQIFLLFRMKINKQKAKLQFNQSKSFTFNMILPGIDEGTDVFSAIMHFM